MKIILKILKWLVIVSIVLLGLLQIDNKQSKESIQWNEEVKKINNSESQAFYLQLGMLAPAYKDPIKFGKERLEEAEKTYGNYLIFIEQDNFPIEFNDPIKKNNLGFQWPKDFCSLDMNNCIESIKSNPHSYAESLKSNQILLERYQQFLALKDYRITTSPNTMLYFGDYQQVISTNKLLQLNILLNSENLEQDTLQLIALTKSKLAESNTLMAKMVHLAVVQLNLGFYNQLLKKQLIQGTSPIPDATESELSLEEAIKMEHAVATTQIKLQHEASGIGFLGSLKSLWFRAFFKENMSINANYQSLNNWLEFSQLAAKEQASTKRFDTSSFSFAEKFRNYAGWVLSYISTPAYSDYSLRLHNLQSKINLLNWYRLNNNKNISEMDLSGTKSLNNFGMGPAYLEEQETELCLPVPIKQRKTHHCISI